MSVMSTGGRRVSSFQGTVKADFSSRFCKMHLVGPLVGAIQLALEEGG